MVWEILAVLAILVPLIVLAVVEGSTVKLVVRRISGLTVGLGAVFDPAARSSQLYNFFTNSTSPSLISFLWLLFFWV